jgi:hypothetical protein
MTNFIETILTMIVMILGLTLPIAWLTHILFCLSTGAWGFLVAGAIFFPIGIIH